MRKKPKSDSQMEKCGGGGKEQNYEGRENEREEREMMEERKRGRER